MPAKPVRNIIFDFGNVLFDLDLPAIGRNFQRLLGAEGAEVARARLEREQVFQRYETGRIGTREFIEALRASAPGSTLSEAQVLEAWNSIFIDFPYARIEMLQALRKDFKLYLLSNINEMHEHWVDDYLAQRYGIRDFRGTYFDGAYYSHLIHLRKPDREIYEYVLADAGILPDETVFYDDLEENVAAACALGIHGILKPKEVEIRGSVEALRR